MYFEVVEVLYMSGDGFESAEVVEGAKAIQEAAKTTGKAIDALQSSGNFFDRVFGELIENSVGIVADKVKFMRFERAAELASKTDKILEDRGVGEDTKAVPPKIAIPLIENATLEDDENLHTLWAQLLANAMDPNVQLNITRVHVSLLKEMEPIDVMILNVVFQEKMQKFASKPLDQVLFDKAKIAQALSATIGVVELSLLNLMRLGCIKPGIITGGVQMGNESMTIYKGTDQFQVSELGVALCQSVANYTPAT